MKNKIIQGFLLLFLWACSSSPYPQGKALYKIYCANCHMEDGSGLGKNIPALAQADYLVTHRNSLACIVKYGLKDTIVVNGITYDGAMPGNESLTDVEITNILNFVFQAWENKLPPIKVQEVSTGLTSCNR
jgi:mono/diheme cytochrome c family protein